MRRLKLIKTDVPVSNHQSAQVQGGAPKAYRNVALLLPDIGDAFSSLGLPFPICKRGTVMLSSYRHCRNSMRQL